MALYYAWAGVAGGVGLEVVGRLDEVEPGHPDTAAREVERVEARAAAHVDDAISVNEDAAVLDEAVFLVERNEMAVGDE